MWTLRVVIEANVPLPCPRGRVPGPLLSPPSVAEVSGRPAGVSRGTDVPWDAPCHSSCTPAGSACVPTSQDRPSTSVATSLGNPSPPEARPPTSPPCSLTIPGPVSVRPRVVRVPVGTPSRGTSDVKPRCLNGSNVAGVVRPVSVTRDGRPLSYQKGGVRSFRVGTGGRGRRTTCRGKGSSKQKPVRCVSIPSLCL